MESQPNMDTPPPFKKQRRGYRACLACRSRKMKCDLGDPDNPQPGPCKRCRRELRECVFASSSSSSSSSSAAAAASSSSSSSSAILTAVSTASSSSHPHLENKSIPYHGADTIIHQANGQPGILKRKKHSRKGPDLEVLRTASGVGLVSVIPDDNDDKNIKNLERRDRLTTMVTANKVLRKTNGRKTLGGGGGLQSMMTANQAAISTHRIERKSPDYVSEEDEEDDDDNDMFDRNLDDHDRYMGQGGSGGSNRNSRQKVLTTTSNPGSSDDANGVLFSSALHNTSDALRLLASAGATLSRRDSNQSQPTTGAASATPSAFPTSTISSYRTGMRSSEDDIRPTAISFGNRRGSSSFPSYSTANGTGHANTYFTTTSMRQGEAFSTPCGIVDRPRGYPMAYPPLALNSYGIPPPEPTPSSTSFGYSSTSSEMARNSGRLSHSQPTRVNATSSTGTPIGIATPFVTSTSPPVMSELSSSSSSSHFAKTTTTTATTTSSSSSMKDPSPFTSPASSSKGSQLDRDEVGGVNLLESGEHDDRNHNNSNIDGNGNGNPSSFFNAKMIPSTHDHYEPSSSGGGRRYQVTEVDDQRNVAEHTYHPRRYVNDTHNHLPHHAPISEHHDLENHVNDLWRAFEPVEMGILSIHQSKCYYRVFQDKYNYLYPVLSEHIFRPDHFEHLVVRERLLLGCMILIGSRGGEEPPEERKKANVIETDDVDVDVDSSRPPLPGDMDEEDLTTKRRNLRRIHVDLSRWVREQISTVIDGSYYTVSTCQHSHHSSCSGGGGGSTGTSTGTGTGDDTERISSIESLLLLSEWPPVLFSSRPKMTCDKEEQDQQDINTILRPSNQYDSLSWSYIGLAVRLAQELGIDNQAKYTTTTNLATQKEDWYKERCLRTWIYCYNADRQVSVRLGRSSVITTHLSSQWWETVCVLASQAYRSGLSSSALGITSEFESENHVKQDYQSHSQGGHHKWAEPMPQGFIASVMATIHDRLYPNREITRAILRTGQWEGFLRSLSLEVRHMQKSAESILSEGGISATLLKIEMDYVLLYGNAIALRALQERFQRRLKANDVYFASATLLNLAEGSFILEAIEAAKSILKSIVKDFPLRRSPARIFHRVLFAAVFLFKALAVGVVEHGDGSIIALLRRTINRLQDSAIDHDHIVFGFAELLRRLQTQYEEMPTTGVNANHPPSHTHQSTSDKPLSPMANHSRDYTLGGEVSFNAERPAANETNAVEGLEPLPTSLVEGSNENPISNGGSTSEIPSHPESIYAIPSNVASTNSSTVPTISTAPESSSLYDTDFFFDDPSSLQAPLQWGPTSQSFAVGREQDLLFSSLWSSDTLQGGDSLNLVGTLFGEGDYSLMF